MRVDTGRLWIYMLPVAAVGVVAIGVSMLLVSPPESHDEEPLTLLLYCAVEARLPVEAIIDGFARRTGTRVQAHYAPSHLLLKEIELGGGDLFLPADNLYMHQARRRGLIEQAHPVAHLVPILLVGTARADTVRSLSDLTAADVRVGLASQETTLGRITPMILQKNDVEHERLPHNGTSSYATATELAQAVELGQIDAAIVWRPLARQYAHRTRAIEIPPERNIVSSLGVAVLAKSMHRDAAGQFADFLGGTLAQEIFRKHDYPVAQ